MLDSPCAPLRTQATDQYHLQYSVVIYRDGFPGETILENSSLDLAEAYADYLGEVRPLEANASYEIHAPGSTSASA